MQGNLTGRAGFTDLEGRQTYIERIPRETNSPLWIFLNLRDISYHEVTHLILVREDEETIYEIQPGVEMHPVEFRFVNHERGMAILVDMNEAAVETVAMYTLSPGEKTVESNLTIGARLFMRLNKDAGISPEEFRSMVINSRVLDWFKRVSGGKIKGIGDIEKMKKISDLFLKSRNAILIGRKVITARIIFNMQ